MSYFIYKYKNQTLKMNQSLIVCVCVCVLGEDIKKRDIFKHSKTIQNIKEQRYKHPWLIKEEKNHMKLKNHESFMNRSYLC